MAGWDLTRRLTLVGMLTIAASLPAPGPATARTLPSGNGDLASYSGGCGHYAGSYSYCTSIPSLVDTTREAANNSIVASESLHETAGAAPGAPAFASEPAPVEIPAADPAVSAEPTAEVGSVETAKVERPREGQKKEAEPVDVAAEPVSETTLPGMNDFIFGGAGVILSMMAGGLITRRMIG